MKDVLKIIGNFVIGLFCLWLIIRGLVSLVSPDYKQGYYKMVVNVHYSDVNVKTYTFENDYPMDLRSSRGSNHIRKVFKDSFFGGYRDTYILETTAPVEIVSYTFKEK